MPDLQSSYVRVVNLHPCSNDPPILSINMLDGLAITMLFRRLFVSTFGHACAHCNVWNAFMVMQFPRRQRLYRFMTHQNDSLYKVVHTVGIHDFQCGDSMTASVRFFTFLSSASFSSLLMMYRFPLSLYCSLDSGMYQQISLHGFSFTSSIFELLQACTGIYIKSVRILMYANR